MKIIVIAGEPATGKSTLMKLVIERLGFSGIASDIQGFPYTVVGAEKDICVLGFYSSEETFGGTDRYAMNIQPKAEAALKELSRKYKVMLFEGDRLFNQKYLEVIRSNFEMKTFLLEVDEETKFSRHSGRGDSQNKTWLAGRETKIRKILMYSNATRNRYNIIVLKNETEQDLWNNANTIIQEINDGKN